jgi:broad specificity phosphatase PhoE
MKPDMKVWLVRHGESTANAGLPSTNHADVQLTPRGREQAEAVAQRVQEPPGLLIVSPFLRARDTAETIRRRWPAVPVETWPIEEFTYLSPQRCRNTTVEMRKPWVAEYWQRADPAHVDGPGAESFAQFMQRLRDFRTRLVERRERFVVAVGHGQFFRALLWGAPHDFESSPARMVEYRSAETARPMANGEIIEWRPTT